MTGPVRVAMTVEQCWQPVPGGSGTYIAELTAALRTQDDVEVVGVAARHRTEEVPSPVPDVPVRHEALPRTVLYETWHRLRRPRADRAGGVDVVHATTWALPGRRVPLVVTVHDLAFLRDPGHFTARGNAFFRRALRLVVDEAARVVVPSAATRDDCVEVGLEPGRVDVVPHGVRVPQVDDAQVAAWRARTGVARPYVLWCGTLEPRKNVLRLVEAFARARGAGLEHDLVLVGPTGWGGQAERVRAALEQLPAGAVHLLGHVPTQDLHVAYAGAAAFAFPSLWEGFGMPVLEALAHGTPVLTSRGTSMAEVVEGAGPAAVLVDPRDVDALAAGLGELVGRDAAAVGVAARDVAAGYTWAHAARAHVGAYRAALGGGTA
ncbi:glycosyl transferase group 1 [Cellulomonas flavigena DSM 20109]|uniref:Glycosyl transferase group 1 n=1 Tax=Cellulomonas flavigena (strain ATCC 482 / DSM 20109 / BCRC 11376 / JCM 18109 / NBRC 3775 / NCIMB 8073 / NRS 134) TaxID=446466 RepID=D5UHD0_CELFN|nr:glycosyltransferase family 1 protein [Cellulomonas flavigena]ADG75251.1 glycosyl transferase group 1 [Cellulomonas flavigena DSM 20109]